MQEAAVLAGEDVRGEAVIGNAFTCGTYANERGYIRISAGPQRGLYVHRLVAAAKLGRELTDDEQVDHINGNPQDNHPDNLEVVKEDAHMHKDCAKPWKRGEDKEYDF